MPIKAINDPLGGQGDVLDARWAPAAAITSGGLVLASTSAYLPLPLQVATALMSVSFGVWLLLRRSRPEVSAELQAINSADSSSSSRDWAAVSGMTAIAPSKEQAPTTSVSRTVSAPEAMPRPPPPLSDGLWDRQLHIKQVPRSSRTVAAFRNIALPSFVPTHTYATGVVGAGPAGLSLAWQLAKQGVSVVVVDNALEASWPNNYGVWAEEWHAMGLPAETISHTWPITRIQYTSDEGCVLPRPYGRVDREVTKAFLLRECVALGVHFCSTHVSRIEGDDWDAASKIHAMSGGDPVLCQMPIVAAGHYSPLLKYQPPSRDLSKLLGSEGEWMTRDWRQLLAPDSLNGNAEKPATGGTSPRGSPWGWYYGGGGAPAYQVAYGEEIVTEEPHGFPVNEMLLMDWTDDHLDDKNKPPTFLYAMPTDEYRIFVEDTSLVSRPTLQMEDLQERLQQRLAQKGIRVKEVVEVERSVIPLGGPLPVLGLRTIAYGASNNLVHPATGYMVNRAIAEAPAIAQIVADSLRKGDSVEVATTVAWDSLWPHDRLRTRDFHVFAMEMLADMNTDLIREFFRTFFKDMKDTSWSEYLAWSMNREEMMSFALGVFFRASSAMKMRLVSETFKKQGFSVIASLLGM